MTLLRNRRIGPDQGLGPRAIFCNCVVECEMKAQNAARRAKPTMWAYYRDMVRGLHDWFRDVEKNDGAYAGAALALTQQAEKKCSRLWSSKMLDPHEAARLWALSVYARRILRGWGVGIGPRRPSLRWLRERGEKERT